ncbi:hypothetical protein BGZ94_009215 [Podila epigama]|nr:hypothetical protein BGZ94_009215 [Podila epigama]
MRPQSGPLLPEHSQFKDKPLSGTLGRLTPRKVILAAGGLLFTYIVITTVFNPAHSDSPKFKPIITRPDIDPYEIPPQHLPDGLEADSKNNPMPSFDDIRHLQKEDAPPHPPRPRPVIQLDPIDKDKQPWPDHSFPDGRPSNDDMDSGSSSSSDEGTTNDSPDAKDIQDDGSTLPFTAADEAVIAAAKARKASSVTYAQMLSSTRRERDYAIALMVREADLALRSTEVYSVTNKNQTAPSGNIHDYLSLSKYYWPNPKTPNGLPYKRIDGHVNPEIETVRDYRLLRSMIREVHVMGMAYHFTGNKDYATKCAMRLREWFLDEKTYMNPNINFGSLRKGEALGARTGVLDMFTIFRVFDALHYLQQEPTWPKDLVPQLKEWFTRYLHWLETSKLAKVERESNNNHGTYFDVQIIAIYLFLDRVEDARKVAQQALHIRIDPQISAKGEQPEEMERKTSWYYSIFNLQALMTLARWGDDLGVDLWFYEGPKGQSIKKAIDFLLPFALKGGEGWPVENLKGFDMTDYLKCLQIAWHIYGDEKYLEAIAYLEPLVQKDMDEGKIKTISTFMCDMSTLLEANTRGGRGFIWHWCLT